MKVTITFPLPEPATTKQLNFIRLMEKHLWNVEPYTGNDKDSASAYISRYIDRWNEYCEKEPRDTFRYLDNWHYENGYF